MRGLRRFAVPLETDRRGVRASLVSLPLAAVSQSWPFWVSRCPSILLAVLWALTSAFSEGAGVEQSARHVISLWLLGTLLAADGIVLLSVSARPRLTASLLLAGALAVAGLAAYTGSVVVLLVCSLAALPLLIAGPFAIFKPSASQE